MTAALDDPAVQAMREQMNRLRGQLFQLVESWGLPSRRERAMKAMIRTLTYAAQAAVEQQLRERG